MSNPIDLSEIFNKVMKSTFINHRGILIERMPQGYKWKGQAFYTIEELDKAINQSIMSLKRSLK